MHLEVGGSRQTLDGDHDARNEGHADKGYGKPREAEKRDPPQLRRERPDDERERRGDTSARAVAASCPARLRISSW